VANNVLGYAAQKDLAQPLAAVRFHKNQIEATRPGEIENLILRAAMNHDGLYFFPRRNAPDHKLKATLKRAALILAGLAQGYVRKILSP
jgi:hypothetical protein